MPELITMKLWVYLEWTCHQVVLMPFKIEDVPDDFQMQIKMHTSTTFMFFFVALSIDCSKSMTQVYHTTNIYSVLFIKIVR